ncbi:hypothetical protein LDO26_11455 [Luteimonas sp. BDR2-5]|uniref:Rap1a/Tai family immunity protein n=1 Tax=Proluteimonas luteida TaxID=2878685 RepID=UPI001E3C65B3|nr:Rap1a/Tai family immunity protein [Luteimonas sp. BDR2-5]MCD9028823.1 hypothetical protein [Luteimonas sp. BDR2-5]
MDLSLRTAGLAFLLTAGSALAAAAAGSGPWLYSGEDLLDALQGNAAYTLRGDAAGGNAATVAAADELRREIASRTAAAYIAGVADASGSDVWCGRGRIQAHEIVARVSGHLQALPAAQRRGNAAGHVRAVLASMAPCGDAGP